MEQIKGETDEEMAQRLHQEDTIAVQMESDRIFAESLALESQQLPPTDSNLPYRPYVRNNRTTNSNSSEFDSNSSQSNPTNQVREGRDELDELSAKFEKLAQEGLIVGRELGAKAGVKLSSFFQTLKAKVDDLAQPPPPPPSQQSNYQQTSFATPTRQSSQRTEDSRPLPASPTAPAIPSPTTKIVTPVPYPPVESTTEKAVEPTPTASLAHLGLIPGNSVPLGSKKHEGDSDDEDDLEYVRSPFDSDD